MTRRCEMRRRDAYIILPWFALALMGGGCSGMPEAGCAPEDAATVNLDIAVSLTDVSFPETRVLGAGEKAATDDEKMQKLRIIIVRPDGTVEHNQLVDLTASPAERHPRERFGVVANEYKEIYLFVNEGMTRVKNRIEEDATSRVLDIYDFDDIRAGGMFPAEQFADLEIGLGGAAEELTGPLPMSERHRVWIPGEDRTCELFVTRAAVKFSFRIRNESGHPLTLTALTIDKLLRRAYYLPKNTVYGAPNEDGVREITSFDVPSTTENYDYYTFEKTFDAVSIAADGERLLEAVYLLEGKYFDWDAFTPEGASARNYSMRVSFEEFGGEPLESEYFTNLSQLPRNTHVVVDVTVRGKSEIKWTVDVVPYGAVVLDPIFGLDEEQ